MSELIKQMNNLQLEIIAWKDAKKHQRQDGYVTEDMRKEHRKAKKEFDIIKREKPRRKKSAKKRTTNKK